MYLFKFLIISKMFLFVCILEALYDRNEFHYCVTVTMLISSFEDLVGDLANVPFMQVLIKVKL